MVLRESYFKKHPESGEEVEWYGMFYWPFVMRWAEVMRGVVGEGRMVFTEAIPNEVRCVVLSLGVRTEMVL